MRIAICDDDVGFLKKIDSANCKKERQTKNDGAAEKMND